MKCYLALAMLIVTQTGCAANHSSAIAGIAQVDNQTVERCAFVGKVDGRSAVKNVAPKAGISNAKYDALLQASRLGADTIVWTQRMAGTEAPTAARPNVHKH